VLPARLALKSLEQALPELPQLRALTMAPSRPETRLRALTMAPSRPETRLRSVSAS